MPRADRIGFSVDSVKLIRESACPKTMRPATVARRAKSQSVATCTRIDRATRSASSSVDAKFAPGEAVKRCFSNAAKSADPLFSVTKPISHEGVFGRYRWMNAGVTMMSMAPANSDPPEASTVPTTLAGIGGPTIDSGSSIAWLNSSAERPGFGIRNSMADPTAARGSGSFLYPMATSSVRVGSGRRPSSTLNGKSDCPSIVEAPKMLDSF